MTVSNEEPWSTLYDFACSHCKTITAIKITSYPATRAVTIEPIAVYGNKTKVEK